MYIKNIIAITLATLWIIVFAYIRNDFFLQQIWVQHYASLGLIFYTTPLQGVLWFVWSLLLACIIYVLLQKYTKVQTLCIAWISAVVLGYISLFNLQVLPVGLIVFAIPLTLLEVWIAIVIIDKLKVV